MCVTAVQGVTRRTECAARVMRKLYADDLGLVTHRPGMMSHFRWFSFQLHKAGGGWQELDTRNVSCEIIFDGSIFGRQFSDAGHPS